MKMNLKLRKFIGRLMQPVYNHYSFCMRCLRPWPICKSHTTFFVPNEGCFPLCEDCWSELTPETRLPYYEDLVKEWQRHGDPLHNGRPWEDVLVDIRRAVNAGG